MKKEAEKVLGYQAYGRKREMRTESPEKARIRNWFEVA